MSAADRKLAPVSLSDRLLHALREADRFEKPFEYACKLLRQNFDYSVTENGGGPDGELAVGTRYLAELLLERWIALRTAKGRCPGCIHWPHQCVCHEVRS
ncbi:MAG TPA: hypothetical protein VFA70_05920 [Dehalococcoidia bacterium]|nr:hypothetical protein [Dehalococcoidia bacterium]